MRNPCDACLSLFNFGQTKSHTETIGDDPEIKVRFTRILPMCVQHRNKFYSAWNSKENFKGAILTVRYENLLNDLENELLRIAHFLDIKADEKVMKCVLKRSSATGNFKRGKKISIQDFFPSGKPKICYE